MAAGGQGGPGSGVHFGRLTERIPPVRRASAEIETATSSYETATSSYDAETSSRLRSNVARSADDAYTEGGHTPETPSSASHWSRAGAAVRREPFELIK